ncbi:MAG: hypothetical protein V7607_977 [Solirubrobacteraceae bacterium]
MRRSMGSGAAIAVLAITAALASAAQAAPAWQCRASAVNASVAGNPTADPVTANTNPCTSGATGLDSLPANLGVPPSLLTAQTVSATTVATPGGEIPAHQGVGAIGRIENLVLHLPPGSGTTTLGLRVANAHAAGVCVAGQPVLDGSSEAIGATLGGQDVPLNQLAHQLAAALAPLSQVVDLKLDEQVRDASSLTVRALHLRILSAAGTPVLDLVAGEARVGFTDAVCDHSGQTAGASGSGGNGAGSANSATDRGATIANGVNGSSRCARLRMYFARNHKTTLRSRYGRRAVVRGRVVDCKGKSIVRARIDVVHVINGKRRIVKTGLRSRAGGALTLILPSNIKTRTLRFEYRGNLLSSKVTSRSTLRLTVRNRKGKIVR